MNITLDGINNFNTMVLNNSSQAISASEQSEESGYKLELGSNQLNENIYGTQQNKPADLLEENPGQDMQTLKDSMILAASTMSEEDFGKMVQDGFDPTDMTPEETVTILDEIKVTLLESGTVVRGYSDTVDQDTAKEITGEQVLTGKIKEALSNNDLPLTEDNIKNTQSAVEKGSKLSELTDANKKYLLENQTTLSIDELYKAEYSSKTTSQTSQNGYFRESVGGYYGRKAENTDLNELEPQIEKALTNMNMEVNEDTIENSKWLIENSFMLNEANLTQLDQINQIELPLSEDEIIVSSMNAIQKGIQPSKGTLTTECTMLDQAKEIFQKVNTFSDDTLRAAVQNQDMETLTIADLEQAESEDGTEDTLVTKNETSDTETSYQYIKAKRQLEEVRLVMTVQANLSLMRQGISIETTALSELVDQLKEEENRQQNILFSSTEDKTTSDLKSLYQTTNQSVKELYQIPVSVIGKVYSNETENTLSGVVEEGRQLAANYQKAGDSYETLMTAPRKDLGDSIQKAFQNIDQILEEQNQSVTEENRRAVRILGYNEMEINETNLKGVKEIAMNLDTVMEKLTPSAVLDLIRSGENPMNMDLGELSQNLDQQSSSEDTEKYSTFLYKAEKSNKITEDEKDSYIGIYRLFRQLEKTDYQAVGMLVENNMDTSIKNLLTAMRTEQAKRTDVILENDTNYSQSKILSSSNIENQINKAFEGASYETKLAKAVYQNLDPDLLYESQWNEDSTLEELYSEIKTSKNQYQEESTADTTTEYEETLKIMKESSMVSEDVLLSSLTETKAPTYETILQMNYLMNQRGAWVKKISELLESSPEKEEDQKLPEVLEEKMNDILENFTNKEDSDKAIEDFAQTAEELLQEVSEKDDITIDQLKEIGKTYQILSLQSEMSVNDSYEIPIRIQDELTALKVTIRKNMDNTEEAGTVECHLETEKTGKLDAVFHMDEESIDGTITGEKQEILDALETGSLKESFSENGKQVELEFQIKNRFKNEKSGSTVKINEKSADTKDSDETKVRDEADGQQTKVQTFELYLMAKKFIQAVNSL